LSNKQVDEYKKNTENQQQFHYNRTNLYFNINGHKYEQNGKQNGMTAKRLNGNVMYIM